MFLRISTHLMMVMYIYIYRSIINNSSPGQRFRCSDPEADGEKFNMPSAHIYWPHCTLTLHHFKRAFVIKVKQASMHRDYTCLFTTQLGEDESDSIPIKST